LLFTPYSKEDIVDILETKKNILQHKLPMKMRTEAVKPIFRDLIDERAYEFIGKKVSIVNGDIRAAFDLMKMGL
jgi:Cdc6-like AAA superfamily ATPase